jgi:hypothetical protein
MPLRFWFLFALAGVTAAATTPPRPSCGADVVDGVFPRAAVRREIADAADRSRRAARVNAAISPLRGLEADQLPPLPASALGQVLSLGSGPDVFRPLRDFPELAELHLVDVLAGWGKSPAAVLVEAASRLRALPGASVRVVARGFTRNFTAPEIASSRTFFAKLETDPHALEPFGWEVTWQSSAAGVRSLRVWLHVVNYHDPVTFPALVERIRSRGPIVGTLVTGAQEPASLSQECFLAAMPPVGAYVFETFGEHFGAEAPGPSEAQRALFRQLGFVVEEAPRDTRGIPSALRTHRTFVAVRR